MAENGQALIFFTDLFIFTPMLEIHGLNIFSSSFLTDIFTITPMLEIHGLYIFYSSLYQPHLTKPRTSHEVRNILKATCNIKQTHDKNGKTLNFWQTFHHHTNAWNTWSLHILFIMTSPSPDQMKNIETSQEHFECNLQKQAWNMTEHWKPQFLTHLFTITPMLQIQSVYLF